MPRTTPVLLALFPLVLACASNPPAPSAPPAENPPMVAEPVAAEAPAAPAPAEQAAPAAAAQAAPADPSPASPAVAAEPVVAAAPAPAAAVRPAAARPAVPRAAAPAAPAAAAAPAAPAAAFKGENACKLAGEGDSPVDKACNEGGIPAAKQAMKALLKAGRAAGVKHECDDCHINAEDYAQLSKGAEDKFAKLLAASRK